MKKSTIYKNEFRIRTEPRIACPGISRKEETSNSEIGADDAGGRETNAKSGHGWDAAVPVSKTGSCGNVANRRRFCLGLAQAYFNRRTLPFLPRIPVASDTRAPRAELSM